ncbi:MAG: helicase C-terminal domain-containing protein [Phycisphaerales bacterium]
MSALVRDILSAPPGGPIAGALGQGYEPRPEQLEMAAAVARALEARSHLLVEAGTGVGKSFAYLVPAIERAVMRKETVVIATNTISLQEQLVQKDIPLLQGALGLPPPAEPGAQPTLPQGPGAREEVRPYGILREGVPLNPVLVKGRGNYVSIRRLQMASQRQDRLLTDAASRRSLHVIEDWATETLDGTLSTLPPLERPAVWDRVQSDSGNCMGRKCPEYRRCFYQNARRRMERANLLVCNHALFFSDLALRQGGVGFLPEYQHVILDEAHNVEDVAAEHFGLSLSEGRVMHLLGLLYNVRSGKGYLPQLGASIDASEIDRAVRLVLHAENESRAFFESLVRAFRSGKARGGRVREPGIVENTLSPAMAGLSLRLGALRELLPQEEKRTEPDRYELNAYGLRAAGIAAEAKTLVEQSMAGCAYWVEVSGEEERRMGPKVTLACSPIEVGPLLKERLFGTGKSVILTSATLADGAPGRSALRAGAPAGERSGPGAAGFGHIRSRLGCENADGLVLGSPFEYASQMELHVERSMPRPESGKAPARPAPVLDEYDQRSPFDDDGVARAAFSSPVRAAPTAVGRGHGRAEDGTPVAPAAPVAPAPPLAYNDLLASRILHHLLQTDGGAFVLFTSFATLRAAAERLAAPLAQRGMPLLVQGKDGPRSQLLQRFRENPRSVLLGAASFWQGVDVRGEGLRNVIITRLPFEPPDRPLTEARLERIQQRGGDPFREDSLPRAVIRFKQGFGRLIRSKADRGRVVVLDPRIVTTGYGKRFLEALPPGVRVVQG